MKYSHRFFAPFRRTGITEEDPLAKASAFFVAMRDGISSGEVVPDGSNCELCGIMAETQRQDGRFSRPSRLLGSSRHCLELISDGFADRAVRHARRQHRHNYAHTNRKRFAFLTDANQWVARQSPRTTEQAHPVALVAGALFPRRAGANRIQATVMIPA